MMTDQVGAHCVFNCGHEGGVYTVSPDRVRAIIAASRIRGDDLYEKLTEDAKVCCHRSCVSTYTSKTHIERLKKRNFKQGTSGEPERKRTHQSEENVFSFKIKGTVYFVVIFVKNGTPRIQADGEDIQL